MKYDDTIPLSGRPSFLNGPFKQMLNAASVSYTHLTLPTKA
ncbi:1-acyl-sn-glycerol-3-phosphate acyltransferase [Lactobacillus rhamnosus GG] [Lacticaseibacillus rhamnosus]|nr:1-acyl-sn-glycerol-3-phosphate acyltransferase [Lactobacillus rhamnosus GG] [Lacticaseibacillus rhamnosus]